MDKKRIIIISGILIISLTLVFQKSVQAADPKPITLVYSSFLLENLCETDKWFMAEVEKRTNGRVTFKKHFGGSLTASMETLPALRSGAVDICNPPPGYFPEELPLAGMMNVTRIPADIKTVSNAGYRVYWSEKEVSKVLEEEAKKQNIKYLFLHPSEQVFFTRVPVQRLSDFKGLKLRSTGLYEPKQVSKWGAIAVNVLPAEWYEALSRGTIDGIAVPIEMASDYKLHEVAKWVSFSSGCIVSRPFAINLDTWNKLPSEVRRLMEGMRGEFKKYDEDAYFKYIEKVMQTYRAAGCKFVKVDPKEQEEVRDAWIEVTIDVWLPFAKKRGVDKEANLLLNRWLELTTGKGLESWKTALGR